MVKVIAYRHGQTPKVEQLADSLDAMRAFVGGYIEGLTIDMTPEGEGLQIICNEEGKLRQLPPVALVARFQDVICGDFFVSRHDAEGETVDVTEGDLLTAGREISVLK